MTWVKLSDDFAEHAARCGLSDAAFRTHIEGLLWTMRRETGGWVRWRDIPRFAETEDPEAAVRDLVDLGWWHHPLAMAAINMMIPTVIPGPTRTCS